ncbi:MAG: MoaD/ThiS family protein [Candidatus Sericytochromatia bacterium]
MKTIYIDYFAKLREEANLKHELIETNSNTAEELFEELKIKHNFSFSKTHLKVSINDEFSDWETEIKDKDNIVFIQPVAGG